MAYVRVYENRIEWENYPSVNTPLDEINLNKMDYALNVIDGTLETWDTTKADESDMLLAVKTITFNDENGQITITFFNGTSTVIDTLLEKVAVNFDYDDDPTSAHYQSLIITLDDGTVKYVDLSALITQYEFIDSSTMHFTVNQDGEITVDIIDGSITGAKLQPNYLADCIAAKNAAQAAQTGAETAEDHAEEFSEDSEAWATGKRGGQDVPSTDPTYHNNAKYYSEMSDPTALRNMSDVDMSPDHIGKGDILINDGESWSNYPSTENKGIAIGSTSIASGENSMAFGWGLASGENSISQGDVVLDTAYEGTPLTPDAELSPSSPITVQASLQLPIIKGMLKPLSSIMSPISSFVEFTFSGGIRCQTTSGSVSGSPVSNSMSFNSAYDFDRLITDAFNEDLSLTTISLSSVQINQLFNSLEPISWTAAAVIGSARATCRLYLRISNCDIEKTIYDKQAILTTSVTLTPRLDPANVQGTTITWKNNSIVPKGAVTTLVRPTASGNQSIAMGDKSAASGNWSYAEGYNATASGSVSSAIGYNVTASGNYSFAEGQGATASGVNSHAEGSSTTASGTYSHSSGRGTIADKEAMLTCGMYNDNTEADTTNYDLVQVGNGTNNSDRSNAFSIRKDGTIGASGGLGIQLQTDSTKAIKFGVDTYGNYGYIKDGADSVVPFRNKVLSTVFYARSLTSGSSANWQQFWINYWPDVLISTSSPSGNWRRCTFNKSGWYGVDIFMDGAAVNRRVNVGIGGTDFYVFNDTVNRCGYLTIDRDNLTGDVHLYTDRDNPSDIEYFYYEKNDFVQFYQTAHKSSSYLIACIYYRYDGSFDRNDPTLRCFMPVI